MARKKEWTRDKIIDAVKHISIAKNKRLSDITVSDIRSAGLYHAVVSEFKGFKSLQKQLMSDTRNKHREYIMFLEDIYKNVLHVPDVFYTILRNYISYQFKQIENANKKKEYIKKYMHEIQDYHSRHKSFPVLTQKQFQNLYRLIKRNHYTITIMSDVLSDVILDTSDAADWFRWLHEITEKYTLASKAATSQFEDKYLVKTVYLNRHAHYYEHKSRTAKKSRAVNYPAF